MGPADSREGAGPLCSQSIFCSGLLPASTTCLLSDCRLAAFPGSMREPQSRCGCQLAEAALHRTDAKDSAVFRVSLCVWKTGLAPCQGTCLHADGQDPSNCSALPVLTSPQPWSRSAAPSVPGELCVPGACLPWHDALLPFSTGEGHLFPWSFIPAIATQLQPAPLDDEYGCWVG